MAEAAGIKSPNVPPGTELGEFLGHEIIGTTRSTRRFTRASVLGNIEAAVNSFMVGGGVIFKTLTDALGTLNYDANQMAWVIQDTTPANNGVYQKSGASGSGSWSRLGDLPYGFYRGVNEGAGTANAIQATNGYPLANNESLIVVNITDDTTASPVTLSLNGGTPLTIKTASGNDPAPGGLIAGMVIAGYIDGTEFRLLSDQASAAIVSAAEAAQVAAEDAKADALDAAAAAIGATGIGLLTTKAAVEAATLPGSTAFLSTAGYFAAGDYGGATYKKVVSAPSHAGKVQSADGAWWEIAEPALNSSMFGVVNDGDGDGGGSDNATTLQNALTVAGTLGARPLRILPGVYRCDSGLTVPAHLEVTAYGATVDFKSAGNVTGVQFTNGGSISGATLLGAGNAAMNAAGVAVSCYGVNNAPAAPTYVAAPLIRDCNIDGWAGYGIIANYTDRGAVTGCVITNIGYAACMGLSANDMLVSGNLIDGVTPGTGDAYGIAFTRQTGASETADPRSYRCKATNNTIRNVFSVSGNNAQGLNTHAGVDLVFSGNVVDHCEVGCIVAGAAISGVAVLGPKRCIVKDNVFISTDTLVGVGTMVSGAIDGSSVNDWAENCVVAGNTYKGFGIAANGLSAGIIIQGTKGAVVTGNTLRAPRCNGIRTGISNVGFNISGNVIINPHDNTHTVPACVYISDSTNRGYVGGNTFSYEADGIATYIAVQAVRIEVSLSGLDLVLTRNSCIGKTTGHLEDLLLTTAGVDSAYI